mgnify:CR=1 FL=1
MLLRWTADACIRVGKTEAARGYFKLALDAVDFDLHDIADGHGTAHGRAHEDRVAGIEGHESAHVADDGSHVEEEVLGPRRLAKLSVHPGFQQKIVIIQAPDQARIFMIFDSQPVQVAF